MIIKLTQEEWIEVIKLVDAKSLDGFTESNKYNDLKTKMLFQFGIQKR
jgi:hypothetical protein